MLQGTLAILYLTLVALMLMRLCTDQRDLSLKPRLMWTTGKPMERPSRTLKMMLHLR